VAEGIGKNKREAKQRAAQLMLKKLHPEATSWGDLLDAEDGESPPVSSTHLCIETVI